MLGMKSVLKRRRNRDEKIVRKNGRVYVIKRKKRNYTKEKKRKDEVL